MIAKFLGILCLVAVSTSNVYSGYITPLGRQVTLAWDANDDKVDGYAVYYGTQSGAYQHRVVAESTRLTISNLTEGETYFFAVAATDHTVESDYSNEVSYTVPVLDSYTGVNRRAHSRSPGSMPGDSGEDLAPEAASFLADDLKPGQANADFFAHFPFSQGADGFVGAFTVSGREASSILARIRPSTRPALLSSKATTDPTLDILDGITGKVVASSKRPSPATADTGRTASSAEDGSTALSATLAPGYYNVVVRSQDTRSPVVLELSDLSHAHSHLTSFSTSGLLRAADEVLATGFVVSDQSARVVVRGLGPSLNKIEPNPEVLSDPLLDLYDEHGSLIFQNENWKSHQEAQILAAGLAPNSDAECAIAATLPPGNYSAVLRSKNGLSGVTVIETYFLKNDDFPER